MSSSYSSMYIRGNIHVDNFLIPVSLSLLSWLLVVCADPYSWCLLVATRPKSMPLATHLVFTSSGTNNNWGSTAMTLVSDYTWKATGVSFTAAGGFKLCTSSATTWPSTNWGESRVVASTCLVIIAYRDIACTITSPKNFCNSSCSLIKRDYLSLCLSRPHCVCFQVTTPVTRLPTRDPAPTSPSQLPAPTQSLSTTRRLPTPSPLRVCVAFRLA